MSGNRHASQLRAMMQSPFPAVSSAPIRRPHYGPMLDLRPVTAAARSEPLAVPRFSATVVGGLAIAGLAWLLVVLLAEPYGRAWGTGQDARCYWLPSLAAPYFHANWTDPIAYVYSPAFLQLISPLTSLPWQVFVAVWTAILIGAVGWLTGPRLPAAGGLVAAAGLGGGGHAARPAGAV